MENDRENIPRREKNIRSTTESKELKLGKDKRASPPSTRELLEPLAKPERSFAETSPTTQARAKRRGEETYAEHIKANQTRFT